MYKRYMFVVAVGIMALLLGFTTRSSAHVLQSQVGNEDGEKLLTTRSFDRWRYEATQVGQDTYIRVSSQISGKSALRALLTDHKGKQPQLFQTARQGSIQQVPVTIVMEEPMTIENFVDFVKEHDIQVQSYTLIAQDNRGELITFFGAPVDEELFPENILKTMVANIEESQNKKVSVKGVVSIDAKVDVGRLTKLNNDPAILGVDITPALALQDLMQQTQGVDASSVHITSAPFYWEVVR